MTYFEIGQKVRLTGPGWPRDYENEGLKAGAIVTVESSEDGQPWNKLAGSLGTDAEWYGVDNDPEYAVEPLTRMEEVAEAFKQIGTSFKTDEANAVDPNHYKFPGGAEVIQISQWLTANAAQAMQYVCRSSRIDGKNKGNPREDIEKAIRFLNFELDRLEGNE